MDREEAIIERERQIKKRVEVFCPMIKAQCDFMCECYKKPEIHQSGMPEQLVRPASWKVKPGECTAAILKGARICTRF